jgi:hypothetical protein
VAGAETAALTLALSPRRGDRLGDIGDERRRAIASVNPMPPGITDESVVDERKRAIAPVNPSPSGITDESIIDAMFQVDV